MGLLLRDLNTPTGCTLLGDGCVNTYKSYKCPVFLIELHAKLTFGAK